VLLLRCLLPFSQAPSAMPRLRELRDGAVRHGAKRGRVRAQVAGRAGVGMKLSQSGAPLTHLDELAPGVLGYAIEKDGAIYIPIVVAQQEGSGDVRRFLDNLPKDVTYKFPCVISQRLLGMLQRRGFERTLEHDPMTDSDVEVWVK
jgi:hypothetical protein